QRLTELLAQHVRSERGQRRGRHPFRDGEPVGRPAVVVGQLVSTCFPVSVAAGPAPPAGERGQLRPVDVEVGGDTGQPSAVHYVPAVSGPRGVRFAGKPVEFEATHAPPPWT